MQTKPKRQLPPAPLTAWLARGARLAEQVGREDESRKPHVTPRFAVVLAALALGALVVYGRSLTSPLVGDDWALIEHSAGGLGASLSWIGNYHYNPVVHVMLFALYALFGLNPLAYHATALSFFWLSAVSVLSLTWRFSGRFALAVVAAVLFLCAGHQYEGVIWGAVSIFQTVGLALFLAGLIGYLRFLDSALDRRSRMWAYGLFMAGVVLSPFAYEPEVVLVPICMLYRLLVVEQGYPFTLSALRQRAAVWARDFTLPGVFMAPYLVFKAWLARTSPQAPGLHAPLSAHVHDIGRAFQLALLSGFGFEGSLAGTPLGFLANHQVNLAIAGMTAIAGILLLLRGAPLQRFLLVTLALMATAMTLGLGGISSRHVLLLSVPAVILLTLLLADLASWVGRLVAHIDAGPRLRETLRGAPTALSAVFVAACAGRRPNDGDPAHTDQPATTYAAARLRLAERIDEAVAVYRCS